MNNISFKLNANIKVLVVPLFVIAAVVLIFVFFAPESISRLNKKIDEFKTVQAEENVYKTKLDSLKSLSSDRLDPEDVTVIALPSRNPGMWVVSQVRNSSRESGVEIVKMSISRVKESADITSSDIFFEFEAIGYSSLLALLNELIVILPVTSLENVSVERERGQDLLKGKLEASFYWFDFPKTLPALNEPLRELTGDEIELIGLISGFKRPVFTELEPGEPQDRLQPFN